MLDTQAALLDAAERPEILGAFAATTLSFPRTAVLTSSLSDVAGLIPDNLEGVRVLELGAGIGRFTGALARRGASRVHAVDFMENLIQEVCPQRSLLCLAHGADAALRCVALGPQNEKQHANLGNTSFEAADVMQMALAAGSFDLVFTNWLFMYLNDAELSALAPRLLRCLSAGGRLFFRESCNRQSGDRSRAFNPSHYRSAEAYTALFGELRGADGSRFMLESTGSVKAYIELKNNPNQIFWVWRKCA